MNGVVSRVDSDIVFDSAEKRECPSSDVATVDDRDVVDREAGVLVDGTAIAISVFTGRLALAFAGSGTTAVTTDEAIEALGEELGV